MGLIGEQFCDVYNPEGMTLDEIRSLVMSNYVVKFNSVRAEAMKNKDFTELDRLKSDLISAGVEVKMSKDGVELTPTTGLDRQKLEGLL